jgi:hypothetical protein
MKKARSHILAVALFAWIPSPGMAGPMIIFDEFGNGFVNGASSPGFVATDPLNATATLAYAFAGISGDVLVTEPNATNGAPSDLLRFVRNQLFVYSDVEIGQPFLGPPDEGVPQVGQSNFVSVPETGLFGMPYTDDANSIVYTPLPGQPGDMGNGVTYVFFSDGSVPEPASMVLMCSGIALVAVVLPWRRRHPA